jgi:hypothetical protein
MPVVQLLRQRNDCALYLAFHMQLISTIFTNIMSFFAKLNSNELHVLTSSTTLIVIIFAICRPVTVFYLSTALAQLTKTRALNISLQILL